MKKINYIITVFLTIIFTYSTGYGYFTTDRVPFDNGVLSAALTKYNAIPKDKRKIIDKKLITIMQTSNKPVEKYIAATFLRFYFSDVCLYKQDRSSIESFCQECVDINAYRSPFVIPYNTELLFIWERVKKGCGILINNKYCEDSKPIFKKQFDKAMQKYGQLPEYVHLYQYYAIAGAGTYQ